ncbi:MAG: hypothetical protein L3K14_06630 [Thermoplasmata archaeon]|nr:hypothetical protein [Thermoplasmata archaeon]
MEPDRLGFLFGVFAGIILFLGALFIFIGGVVSLVINGFSSEFIVNTTSRLILDGVLGLLFVFFAALAARRQGDFTLAGGVILVVLSVGTWYVLGLHLFEALAGIFGLIAGILFLVARR